MADKPDPNDPVAGLGRRTGIDLDETVPEAVDSPESPSPGPAPGASKARPAPLRGLPGRLFAPSRPVAPEPDPLLDFIPDEPPLHPPAEAKSAEEEPAEEEQPRPRHTTRLSPRDLEQGGSLHGYDDAEIGWRSARANWW